MSLKLQLFLICAIILFGACWQIASIFFGHRTIVNLPPKGSRIVALGDSLTVGVGASIPQNGLIPQLERRIGFPIVNKGVSGDTTGMARARLAEDVLKEKPNIVIVLLGGNDYLKRIPEKETFDNLRFIISQIQPEGAVVVLLGIRGGLLADHFDDNFSALADETGSLFVPNVLDNILGDTTLMSDEIHPNDRGYEKMVDKIAPQLLGILAGLPHPPNSSLR